MIRHYITIALRTLWRNRFHTFINIIGLAIGVSACLVIYLIVSHELSFNKKITDYDRIYRVHSKFAGTFTGINRGAPTATADYIQENFKGVEKVCLFFIFSSDVQIQQGAETKELKRQPAVMIAAPDYFELFNFYTWVAGSPEVLTKPNQVVLTESQAKKYFGNDDPTAVLGREVIYRDSLHTFVGGIVSDLDFQTDFVFTDFISQATIESSWLKNSYTLNDWTSVNSSTQVFLKALPGTNHQDLLEQLPGLSEEYKQRRTWEVDNKFNVQSLADLHYDTETEIFDFSNYVAHMPTLLTLGGVAILLLIIAAINFINLETAQAVRRAKEVGVRKVLGSSRTRLVIQFLSEGLLVTVIAVLLALPITELCLSAFSEFVPDGVSLNIEDFFPFLVIVVLFIGLLASTYPAFVLSSFMPVLALKNQAYSNGNQSRTAFLRKVLIIFQFTFAQVLILGTIMVGWQIRYLLNKDLGFKRDAVVYFDTPWWDKKEKTLLLKNEIESIPEVSAISLSQDPPSSNGWSSSVVEFHGGTEVMKINVFRKFGDTKYLDFYGIELLAGRNLLASDTVREFLINETLLRQLGFSDPQEAIGQTLLYNQKTHIPIVGVVKDFHVRSLHVKLEPVMMSNEESDFSCINIRLNSTNRTGEALKESLDKIETAWKKIYPDSPFEYAFLDDTIKNYYHSERRISKLSRTAMGLAIFISCLGLFGLASFSTAQRTKEIGIRKVLGASVRQIVMLLSRDFILLVVIAFLIAAPIAWMSMSQWLQGFPYHTHLSTWMFIATAVMAIVIAFVTVSYQTVKAANRNPTDSLRSE